MTIQDRCAAPPRSRTIVGRAVATMVWSSAASSIASIKPPKIVQIARDERSREYGLSADASSCWRS